MLYPGPSAVKRRNRPATGILPCMPALALSFTETLSGKPRVSYDEFLALTDSMHVEWVAGEVVPIMALGFPHNRAGRYGIQLLGAFLGENPIGELFYEPMQTRAAAHLPGRSPDIMVLLNEHADRLHLNYIEGPVDLAVEIISPESGRIDRGEKFYEYEEGGVPEYWIIDPVRESAEFYQLDDRGVYRAVLATDGVYRSRVLAGFWMRVEWLWQRPPLSLVLAEWAA